MATQASRNGNECLLDAKGKVGGYADYVATHWSVCEHPTSEMGTNAIHGRTHFYVTVYDQPEPHGTLRDTLMSECMRSNVPYL